MNKDKTNHHFTFQERVMLSDLSAGDYIKKADDANLIYLKEQKKCNTIKNEK